MKKHPPDRRYPAGLEWVLLKKLPLLTLTGFAVLVTLGIGVRVWSWEGNAKQIDDLIQRFDFALIGAGIFHITMMVTLLIGCVVVWIMKGPRYTADSYPVEDAERPDQ